MTEKLRRFLDVSDRLASRMFNHAFCDSHPRDASQDDCPFCQDRIAYADYLKARATV